MNRQCSACETTFSFSRISSASGFHCAPMLHKSGRILNNYFMPRTLIVSPSTTNWSLGLEELLVRHLDPMIRCAINQVLLRQQAPSPPAARHPSRGPMITLRLPVLNERLDSRRPYQSLSLRLPRHDAFLTLHHRACSREAVMLP